MSDVKAFLQGRIFDVIKGSVATATLFLAFMMLPVFGLIPGLFTPAPALFYGIKGGRRTGFAIVAVSCGLLAAVSDPAAVVIYLLQAGVLSLALTEFLLRHKGGARSTVYAVAITLVAIFGAALAYSNLTGADIHAKVTHGVQSSIAQTVQLYQKAGIKGDELKGLQDSMSQAGAFILTAYPALVTVTLGVLAALNLFLLRLVAARVKMPVYLGDFKKYRNPEPLVWLLIAAGFSMLVDEETVRLVALNLLIVVCTLYAVQGFAVVGHFFQKFAVPKFFKVFGCLLLLFQPFLLVAVAALGIFDLWGDFRTPKQQANL